MRTHLDLFSGIGGFALACRWAGVETIGFAEIDAYASRVLAKNFLGVVNYGDVRNVPAGAAWLVTGGFPCQPFSVAGKRQGTSDDRWLWPEMAGVIERVRPAWVLAENVPGIIRMELDTVLSDLERLDYTAWPVVVPAVAVDAPHRRERVWIVGNTERSGFSGQHRRRTGAQLAHGREDLADALGVGQRKQADETDAIAIERKARQEPCNSCNYVPDADNAGRAQQRQSIAVRPEHPAVECTCRWPPEPDVGRVADGIPGRMDRLKGLGNAIVPQVAYQLIRMMIETEEQP